MGQDIKPEVPGGHEVKTLQPDAIGQAGDKPGEDHGNNQSFRATGD